MLGACVLAAWVSYFWTYFGPIFGPSLRHISDQTVTKKVKALPENTLKRLQIIYRAYQTVSVTYYHLFTTLDQRIKKSLF